MLPMQAFLDYLRDKLKFVLICISREASGHVFDSRLFCLQRTLPQRFWLKYHRVLPLLNRPGTSPYFQVPFCTSNASSPASWETPSGHGLPRSGSFSRVSISNVSKVDNEIVRSIGHVAMRHHFLLWAEESQATEPLHCIEIYWPLLRVILQLCLQYVSVTISFVQESNQSLMDTMKLWHKCQMSLWYSWRIPEVLKRRSVKNKINRCFGGTCCLHLQDWRISHTRNQCEAGGKNAVSWFPMGYSA
jgi:hypothetical protein